MRRQLLRWGAFFAMGAPIWLLLVTVPPAQPGQPWLCCATALKFHTPSCPIPLSVHMMFFEFLHKFQNSAATHLPPNSFLLGIQELANVNNLVEIY